jgi:NADH:ubiquinone oxidoreductase subunit E
MIFVTICVGSSCHIHGSEQIIELLDKAIREHGMEDEIIPSGGFCFEKCNRHGVTMQVDDDIFTGITPESFDAFFNETILPRAQAQR